MPPAKPELKAECIRLRTEERLSLREIQAQTGASKGSLSTWLKPHPLTKEEKRARHKIPTPQKKDRGEESELHTIVRAHEVDNVQIAKIAETAVLLRLMIRSFRVFGSMFDGDRADWIVEVPQSGRIYKLQVKCTTESSKGGLPSVSLRHAHNRVGGSRRYTEGDFDFIIGFDLFTDIAYVWSWKEVEHLKASVTICPEAKERWDKLLGM